MRERVPYPFYKVKIKDTAYRKQGELIAYAEQNEPNKMNEHEKARA